MAFLSGALACRARPPAYQGIGDGEVVGPQALRGDHSPVPAPARPLWLYRRAAVRAAAARCHRARDRGRHRPNHEGDHRARADGSGSAAVLKPASIAQTKKGSRGDPLEPGATRTGETYFFSISMAALAFWAATSDLPALHAASASLTSAVAFLISAERAAVIGAREACSWLRGACTS